MHFKLFLLGTLLFGPQLCAQNGIKLVQSLRHAHAIQPLIKNERFFNSPTENRLKHTWDAIKIFWATKTSSADYFTHYPFDWIHHNTVLQQSISLQLQWIGHASFLIQVNDFNILTDPVFYDLNALLYPRKTPAGIAPENLPRIDFVIISHNHRDHLDAASMKMLKSHQPIMLVPKGTKDWFINRGFKYVMEHSWWQTTTFKRNDRIIKFTFVPATHWSGRNMLDAHSSLWGGWTIQANNKTVYFAGDTGFNEPIFNAIKEHVKTIDCALLPIGPCEPRSLMCHSHMGPEEAVAAYKILKPNMCVPMHWGTFGLGPDSFDAPIKRLDSAWKTHVPAELQDRLYKIKFGERISV